MKCLVLWSNFTLCEFAAWIKMHLCSLLGKYAAGCLLWVSCTSLKYCFLSCLFITHLYTWELSKFQLKMKTTGILYGWKMVCWLCPEQKRLRSHVGFGMQFWVKLGTNLWVKAGDLAVLFSGQVFVTKLILHTKECHDHRWAKREPPWIHWVAVLY